MSTRGDAEPSASAYRRIVEIVYQHSRIDLGNEKQTLVSNRLRQRLKRLGIESYDDYCRRLNAPGAEDEIEVLIDLIATNHTHFFREADHFHYVTEQIVPELLPQLRAARTPLGVWSAACSSGEEPYSLAIVLAECLHHHPAIDWAIDASDISRNAIATAERAIYRLDALKRVSPDLRKRYFQEGLEQYAGFCRVRKELRSRVRFGRVNLFQSVYPIPYNQQIIFLRNVMIYFDLSSRQEAIDRLTRHLAPGGYLIIGHAETLFGVTHGLVAVKPGIFRKP